MTDIQPTTHRDDISPAGEKIANPAPVDSPPAQPVAKKSRLGAVGLIFACGAALFSDGYVNAASGPTVTILSYAYPDYPGFATFESRFSSLVFAGTVFGMLLFGFSSTASGAGTACGSPPSGSVSGPSSLPALGAQVDPSVVSLPPSLRTASLSASRSAPNILQAPSQLPRIRKAKV